MQGRKKYGYRDCVQVLGWYNKQCVGYVLYSLHVCVWARQIRQLRLTIPTSFALCVVCVGRFPGGVPGGPGLAPPGYAQRSALGSAPEFFFGRFLLF
jgi:hypothetical protein